MPAPTLLIDLSALFRAAWHVIPSDGKPSIAYEATLSAVSRCVSMTREYFKLEENEKLRTAICCDGKGNWRKEISKEYKSQREQQPASMYGMLDRVKTALRKDGRLLWECEGYEADDVIGAACDVLAAKGSDDDRCSVVIASHDKDLCQLSSPEVVMLKTHTWEFKTFADIIAKFGVKPFQIVDILALWGDKADNVQGCDGCGEKTAQTLVAKYGTVEKLYEYIDNPANTATDKFWRTSDGKRPLAILDKLLQSKAQVLLAKKLVQLKYDAPINIADLDAERKPEKRVDSGLSFDDTDFPDFEADARKEMEELENRVFGGAAPAVDVLSTETATTEKQSDRPLQATLPDVASVVADGKAAHAAKSAPEKVTAMVVYGPGEFERSLEPRTSGSAVLMGELIHNSGMYGKFKNPAACTVALMRGREMGFGALVSCDVFEVVKDKLCPKAHLIIHLGETHPDCEYLYLSDESHEPGKEYAEYTIRRRSWPAGVARKHRYTIQEAVDAGLATLQKAPKPTGPKDDRGQWDKRRPEMLRKTAGAQTVRIYLPGAGLGLTSSEEMGGDE